MPQRHRPRPLAVVAVRTLVLGALLAVPGGLALASTATAAPEHHYGAVPFHTTHGTSGSAAPLSLTSPSIAATPSNPNTVEYGGGISGVGVITGAPKVYLVFWGSQWGNAGATTVHGKGSYASFAGDPDGVAPDLQAFFAGLGTGSDGWSGVMTQYCQSNAGVTLTSGATTCPGGATHVGYPTGGALGGVWEDTRGAAPASASQTQIGQEAEAAAGHFGLTTTAANRNVEYVIASPTGTNPDSYLSGGFCGWHDDSADPTMIPAVQPTNGTVAFTNLPYLPDVGASCGQDIVNPPSSSGIDDGVTVVAGHEYAEWLTDPYPGGGWWNQGTGADAHVHPSRSRGLRAGGTKKPGRLRAQRQG